MYFKDFALDFPKNRVGQALPGQPTDYSSEIKKVLESCLWPASLFAFPKDLEYQRSSCVQVGSLVNLHAEEIPEVDSLSMIQEKKTTIVKKNHGIFLV